MVEVYIVGKKRESDQFYLEVGRKDLKEKITLKLIHCME